MSKYKKPLEVSIPEAYDLGFCTVNKTTNFPFTIFNPNAKPINYQFKFTQFIISPSKGTLMPNSLANFKIQFTPTQATVIVGTVIVQIQGQGQRVYRLSAVGKYPYLSIASNEVDFGNVLVTKNVSKQIILKNNSEVPAQFHIQNTVHDEDYNDNFYIFNPDRGLVPPKMSYAVKINYQPKFVDATTINNFKMVCESGNKIDLSLKGHSNRFNVAFNSSSINFGQIKLDGTCAKVLTISNNSELQTQFEFFVDSGNIFAFNQIKGTIPKNSYKKIIIEFRPRNTITYYQRVYCIIRNHLLLFVDLMGTCYDLLIKPIPLYQVHIDTFRKRVIQGRISQIQLKYIENNVLIKLAKKLEMTEQGNGNSQQNFYQTNTLIKEHPYVLQKQLFLQSSKNQLISISQDCLQFGFCEIMTLSGQREIQVTNKLQCKLNVFWISQKKQNLNGEYMTVFNIYPQTATLKPNVPTKFTITFRPLKSNTYYFQHLQFYAIKTNSKISKKTLEEFQYRELKSKPESTLLRNVKLNQTIQSKVRQNVEATQVLPPICGVVRCVGHSFSPNSLPFLPIMKVFPSNKITFKPALINTSSYDSIELVNQSDTPIYYRMGQDLNKAFKFFPKIGLIQPKSFSIVAIQFTPTQYKTYVSNINVHLNDMPGNNTKLTLTGICTAPELELQNQGKVFFSPTFTGVYTSKKYKVKNTSKSKILYKIIVPQKYIDQLHFQPAEKQLQANETFELTCYFTPRQKRQYKIKVPIQAIQSLPALNSNIGYHSPGSSIQNSQEAKQQNLKKIFWIEINGEGSDGNLKISHEQLNFQSVKITQQKKLGFTIKNTADCAFFLQILLKNNDFQSSSQPSQSQLNNVFQLDFRQGNIPANSQISVNLTFSPLQVANYDLKLIVNARQKAPKKINTLKTKNLQPSIKCQMKVKAQGNYPLLEIIDIRNDTLSVAALWENFQIEKINNELSCKLDSQQKKYLTVQNLTFTQTKNLQNQLKHYSWNLGYVSTKSKAKPRKVLITVKNYGGTPLNYAFKFPSDNKVEEELWADPGEPTQEQAYQKAILQKNIFQIKPKIGRLQPGQVKDIQLIYSPCALENNKTQGSNNQIHQLKVVFQIQNGKSLVFNLKGTTLGPNEGLITVKKTNYILPESQIGLLQPVRFPIQVNNVGSIKINYKTQIIYEEGQYPQVLKIQNPSHFLLPGQNMYLYILYKPLIKKIYNFKVLIHVFDFNKEIQTLSLNLIGDMTKTKSKKQDGKVIPHQRSMVSDVGSKVFFSIQQIDFGKMIANDTKYRVILLYNMSKQHGLNFDFPTQMNLNKLGLTCGDKFLIEPNNGSLEPNSFVQLKITLTSSKNPSFYEGQIPCNIIWAQNRFSSEDMDMTQKEMTLSSTKQSLFLRIKKQSVLDSKKIIAKNDSKLIQSKKTLLQNIFTVIIQSTINDPQIQDLIGSLENQQTQIFNQIDQQNPASLNFNNFNNEAQDLEQKKDYSNYQHLILNDEFKDVTQIIMENTFFNIIQETTHQENDLLRVGKKFIQSDMA